MMPKLQTSQGGIFSTFGHSARSQVRPSRKGFVMNMLLRILRALTSMIAGASPSSGRDGETASPDLSGALDPWG